MQVVKSTYHEFPNEEILLLESYPAALKHLSFSLRVGESNQEVFAYVSFRSESIKELEGEGVRITEIENRNGAANGLFFDCIISAVRNYERNGVYCFDYLWFNPCNIFNLDVAKTFADIKGFIYNENAKIWVLRISREQYY